MTEAANSCRGEGDEARCHFLGGGVAAITVATGAFVIARRTTSKAVREAVPVAVAETDGGMSIEPGPADPAVREQGDRRHLWSAVIGAGRRSEQCPDGVRPPLRTGALQRGHRGVPAG